MTYETFYGTDEHRLLLLTEKQLMELIDEYSKTKREKEGVKPIVYSCSRIKSPESMIEKLKSRGFEPTREAALRNVYDAVGVRAICAFA